MNYNGKIITSSDQLAPFGGKYFFVEGQVRRWICTGEAAASHGLNLSDVIQVPSEVMSSLQLGGPLSVVPAHLEAARDGTEARAFILKDLAGVGVEFGPGAGPMPHPIGCKVLYADQYVEPQLGNANTYFGNAEFPKITYKTSMDMMDGIGPESIDFIISSHVIEHVPRTIQAFQRSYLSLKRGGILFMAIPHYLHTFDKNRDLTTIDHFIQDYTCYSDSKNIEHLIDNIENVDFIRGAALERGLLATYREISAGAPSLDMHYHTFAESNIGSILDWFDKNIEKWRSRIIIPRIGFVGSNEFYVILTK